jgi:hypothetical protein
MKASYKTTNILPMKKIIFSLILLLCFNVTFSQQNERNRKKIKALKATYITTELNFSSSEAEKFWPIYNASEEKHRKFRNEARKLRKKIKDDFETISEKDAKVILEKSIEFQNKIHEERNQLIRDLISFLPAKKIILLKKAEDDFTRKLIKKFKNKGAHRNEKDMPPPHGGANQMR